jgi:hypothetical protein
MKLEGSCHCGAVTFSLQATDAEPYLYCYCSICRKTAGGGGYAINLFGKAATLKVRGKRNIRVYRVRGDKVSGGTRADKGKLSEARRSFCGTCGSALWVWDPRWPKLIHPFASAIDSELPKAASRTHIMLDYAPRWVPVPKADRRNRLHREYPPGE